jgi:hypothetical protein
MTCVQCFLVVSKDCPHCRNLLAKAKDAVEMLTRRGMLIVNAEDFPDTDMLYTYSVSGGDLRLVVPTPQVVCIVQGEGGVAKVFQMTVKSHEEFHEVRRFIEAKIHWLKLQYGKMCFETRGRKKKEESGEPKKRRGRKKKEEAKEEAELEV